MIRKSNLRLLVLGAPLLLAACGDGWEAQRTTEIFPYGNERTAGSGVVYVLAKMLPEKDIVLEKKVDCAEPCPKMKAGDQVFADAQKKGAHSPAKSQTEENTHDKKAESAHGALKERDKADSENANITPAAGGMETSVSKAINEKAVSGFSKSYGQMPSKKSLPQDGMNKALELEADEVVPEKGSSLEQGLQKVKAADLASIDIIDIPEETGVKTSSLPAQEITSPILDTYDFKNTKIMYENEGEKSLDEIYSDPF